MWPRERTGRHGDVACPEHHLLETRDDITAYNTILSALSCMFPHIKAHFCGSLIFIRSLCILLRRYYYVWEGYCCLSMVIMSLTSLV